MKLALLVTFVGSLALLAKPAPHQLAFTLALLVAVSLLARLPTLKLLRRGLLVAPFVGVFSLILLATGDSERAWAILSKTYLSTLAVLVIAATSTLPALLEAARWFRIPGPLVEVTQLIYRYLFLLISQGQQMRTAFSSRGGEAGVRAFEASAGMVAVLFTRSYERAAQLHQAMLGRGFDGALPGTRLGRFAPGDIVTLMAGIALAISIHYIPS